MMREVQHDNLLKIHEIYEGDNNIYCLGRLYEGENLNTAISNKLIKFDEPTICNLIYKMLEVVSDE